MKKLVSLVLVFVAFLFLSAPKVEAAGAITADEQRILDTLRQPVTVNGKTFSIPANYIAQAENYLKQQDISANEVNEVIGHIQSTINLVSAQNVDISQVQSLEDLIRLLPANVVNQIKNSVSAAANVLGLVVTSWNGGNIVLSSVDNNPTNNQNATENNQQDDSTANNQSVAAGGTSPVYSSAQPVKQTGTTYYASFATAGFLLTIAVSAFVIGKKNYA